jgi:hypothetical protein
VAVPGEHAAYPNISISSGTTWRRIGKTGTGGGTTFMVSVQ